MMSLAEIIRMYYHSVHNHMEDITKVTFEIMQKDEEEVATLAIEVWCSLCEEEIWLKKHKKDCNNYTEAVFNDLLQLILTLLNDSNIEEDEDSDTWNRSTAAGCCLHLLANNVGDQIIQNVISFVETKISPNASWKDKYFGLLALGAILEGPSRDSILQVLNPAMEIILNLYQDDSRKVRETTAWFFSKVAANHHELLTSEAFFEKLYTLLLNGLKDELRVACNSASIINELAKSLKPMEGQTSNLLSNVYPELIEKCLEAAYRQQDHAHDYNQKENKIRLAGFDALYSLFENAPPNVEMVLQKSLQFCYEKIQEINGEGDINEEQQSLQSFLLVCLQTILNRLETGLTETICDSLVDIIMKSFEARGDVFEEGFLLFSALCSKFGAIMDNYVPKIGPFINHALKTSDSSDTVKNACGLISDLCTMVESKNIIEGFREYVPLLHQIMTNKKLSRDAKLGAVTAIGDTFLMTKENYLPFLDETLSLFSSAAEKTVDVNQNDDDLVEYVIKLQGALIESYTCIVQEVGHNKSEIYTKLADYVPGIIKFCII
jgi:importin subunit beta-1